MSKRLLIVCLHFCIIANSYAQTDIVGEVQMKKNTLFYLFTYQESDEHLYDSVQTDENGKFSYQMPTQYKGIVTLKQGRSSFHILVNEPYIEFKVEQLNPEVELSIVKSKENIVYHAYLAHKKSFTKRSNLLMPLIYNYPKEDPFYVQIKEKFIALNEENEAYLDELVAENSNLLATSIIQFERLPYIHPNTPDEKAFEIFKENFFKYASFYDTLLFQTPMFAKKVVEYLSFFTNKNFTREQQEQAFMDAATRLMELTYDYPNAYTYMIDYLIKGFKQFGFDNVVDYIAENSDIEGSCKNTNVNEEVQRRIENLKKMTKGKKAPNFETLDLQGKLVNLKQSEARYKLVVFWSSDCPHCKRTLPKIHDLYTEYTRDKFDVFSISLDTSTVEVNSFIERHGLTWKNICDLEGWNGEIASQYNIYATPMMFLLDEQLTIIAKPPDTRELEKRLNSLD